MNQIFKSKNSKPKEEIANQSDKLGIFIKLITSGQNYPFPKQDISGRLIVVPFTSRYTMGQSEP